MIVRHAVLAVALAGGLLGCMSPRPPASVKDDTCAAKSTARTPEQRRVYRLELLVATTDPGKPPVNSTQTLNVEERMTGDLHLGSNIPISSQARQDVGLMIRCTLTPVGDDVLLEHGIEMSSADEGGAIRKVSMRGSSVVSPGKPALLASAEDPTTHRRFEVTVTATKLR